MSVVKLVVEDRCLSFLGILGVLSLAVGFFFSLWMIDVCATSGQIITNLALASLTFILIDFILVSTVITLYAITRLSNKMNKDN
jgi:hypothetical protein